MPTQYQPIVARELGSIQLNNITTNSQPTIGQHLNRALTNSWSTCRLIVSVDTLLTGALTTHDPAVLLFILGHRHHPSNLNLIHIVESLDWKMSGMVTEIHWQKMSFFFFFFLN